MTPTEERRINARIEYLENAVEHLNTMVANPINGQHSKGMVDAINGTVGEIAFLKKFLELAEREETNDELGAIIG